MIHLVNNGTVNIQYGTISSVTGGRTVQEHCQLWFIQSTIYPKRIEYILVWNLLEKSGKRPFCCTVSILQVYFTYLCSITFWALEYHSIENLKLMLKENQIIDQ